MNKLLFGLVLVSNVSFAIPVCPTVNVTCPTIPACPDIPACPGFPTPPVQTPVTVEITDIPGGQAEVYTVPAGKALTVTTTCSGGSTVKQGAVILAGVAVSVSSLTNTNSASISGTCQNHEPGIVLPAGSVIACQGKTCLVSGFLTAE